MGYIGIPCENNRRWISNDCINGFFDIWQRGDIQTDNGYKSDDRWRNRVYQDIRTHEKGYFTTDGTAMGSYSNQGVPSNPKYFSRTNITETTNSATNYVIKQYVMYDVTQYASKIMRVVFWARSDDVRDMTVEGYQSFGLGGSDPVSKIYNQKITLTTEWKKYSTLLVFPSIKSKIFGTTPTYQSIYFWMSAGTNHNSRTINLGSQTGVFDIAAVEMYPGSDEQQTIRKTAAKEYWDCLPYYETGDIPYELWGADTETTGRIASIKFNRHKIITPSISTNELISSPTISDIVSDNISPGEFRIRIDGNGFSSIQKGYLNLSWTANAEL